MKKTIILAALLLLAACDHFEGTISVKQPLTVKSTESSTGCSSDSSWGCDQIVNVTIPIGDHSGKMHFIGRDQIQLKLKINGKKKQLDLVLPKKLNIPSNGTFVISAADLGQDFGAQGGSTTSTVNSELRTGYESCTYQRPELEWRTVFGRQYVEYFDRRTDQQININFVSSQNLLLATYGGQKSSNERIYRHKAECF